MTLQNLDLALRVDEPSKSTDMSSANERSFYEKWEHSNRSCLMVMKYTMDKSIKECVPKIERVKDFLEYLLTTTVYDGVGGVRDHIIKLKHYFNKANELKVELSEKFLKWLILKSLPTSFDKNETHSIALVTNQGSSMKKKPPHKNSGGSKQFKRRGNSSQGATSGSASFNATKNEKFKWKCNFCHKVGHKWVDCFKVKNWLKKKKKDKIMTNKMRSSKHEEFVYMGDGSKVKVEFFGMIKLRLATESFLLLHDVVYIPSLRRNLIYVSVLDRHGYSFHFGDGKVDIFSNSVLIGNGVLFGNLYSLSLHHDPLCDSSSVNSIVGCKRARMNLSSSLLWHKHLGHISRQRLKRLVRDRVLSNLDFLDFETCVVCLKWKMTAKTRKEKIGRYGYVELIHEKYDSLNVCKAFKAKVELYLEKPIKYVKSDRGGDTSQHNGVAEMRNRTLLDMVSKYVPKTPYELWSGKKSSLHHFHVWGWVPDFIVHLIPLGSLSQTGLYTLRMKLMLIQILCLMRYLLEKSIEHGDQVEPGISIDDTVVDEILLIRSQRVRRPAISDDYMIYLQEHEYDGYDASNPVTYQKAIHCPQFTSWKEAMDDEMNSMYMNGVWDLVDLPHGCKPVGCKWVFKTKRDSSG
ncbi:hypothetical protein AAG906_017486 [Vitis piasezkii]